MNEIKGVNKKAVFIVGAGASAAICPDRIPCMGDYFEKLVAEIEGGGETKYWLPLICLEEARVLPANPEAEKCATRVRTIEWEIYTFKEKGLGVNELQNTQSTYLKSYIGAFKQDSERVRANLEKILNILENSGDYDTEDARIRLLMSIHTFFSTLDGVQEITKKFDQGPHQKLSEFLKESTEVHATFICFNYDLWLEKALQRSSLWSPATGYGHQFLYAEPHPTITETGFWGHYEARSFKNATPCTSIVLKPNGSLSWFVSSRVPQPVVLTSEGQEAGEVSYNRDFHLDRMNIGPTIGQRLAPLIVPPLASPNRRYPVFWSIDQNIQKCLKEADAVVIIGWSLPPTDQKFADDFKRAISSRKTQLQSLVLCDIALGESGSRSQLIHKFEALFRPANPALVRKPEDEDGFSENFVKFLEEVLRT